MNMTTKKALLGLMIATAPLGMQAKQWTLRDCINYALENNINPSAKLFDIGERAVNKHLHLVCDYLGYEGIGSHSFRKYFATSIYVDNNYDINLVRVLLQHSSTVTTQRYIGIQNKNLEDALQNHIKFFD